MKQFPFMNKSKKVTISVSVDIGVTSGGKDDRKKHNGTQRHQIALKEGKEIQPVTSFF